tara:strand:+ start:152 stop:868 length:717 start_codon:yes stop_codon:yes gene_type:complete
MSNSNLNNKRLKVPNRKTQLKLVKSGRRTLRKRGNIGLEYNLARRQNSANNDEPESMPNLYPIIGKRSKRPNVKNMRNQHYRCNDLEDKSKEINCHKKLQYYNVFVNTHINNFTNDPSNINANNLIDILIRLKRDTALMFGDEYQTEIVKDFLMYLYNNNKKVYFMLEDHYRFDEMMTHVHIPKKSMLNKVRNTLTRMRHRGRVAPTNIRNNRRRNNKRRSRSRSRIRKSNNSSLDNL